MCRRHYYQCRYSEGLDGSSKQTVVLNALCYRWGASAPKLKSIKCVRTVGVMPACPMCDSLMRPITGDHFICSYCWTEAKFNSEEVSWLASSVQRLTSRSRPTVRS